MAALNVDNINLFQAVATGSMEHLRKAFTQVAKLIATAAQTYNDEGETPLLLAIRNRHFKIVKFLVNELKVPVIQVGQFTWERVDYVDIPPLFAAIISNHLPIVDFLVENEQNNSPVDLAQSSLILSCRTPRVQKINILELMGAAYIFYGNMNAREYGYSCWMQAFLLRQSTTDGGPTIPKIPLQLSNRGATALKTKEEVSTFEQLNRLKLQRRSHWQVQAFLLSHRIFGEIGHFPNLFTIVNLFSFSLKRWSERRLNAHRAFEISLFIIELYGNNWWEEYTAENKMSAWEVINSTLHYLCSILKNLGRTPNRLPFSDLMFVFRFAGDHLQKTYMDYWPTSGLCKTRKSEIDNMEKLILIIANLIIGMQNILTLPDIHEFKQCFAQHVFLYEQWLNEKSRLLLRACAIRLKTESMFEVIKLLLEIGANPNAVDSERRSPLHFLTVLESSLYPWNQYGIPSLPRWSPVHGRNFSTTVRAFLEAGYHVDQINRCGETAFECIKLSERYIPYPDAEFQSLMNDFLEPVRRLSCSCARVIMKHGIPIGYLPVKLQVFTNYH